MMSAVGRNRNGRANKKTPAAVSSQRGIDCNSVEHLIVAGGLDPAADARGAIMVLSLRSLETKRINP
jgi:hypothetical protein